MIDDEAEVTVTIGGELLVVPAPMTFFCLRRAWPHVRRLGELGELVQAVSVARAQAVATQTDEANMALGAAIDRALAAGADLITMTEEGLAIIAAAFAQQPNPPTRDDLARKLRPDEMLGVQHAVNHLFDVSGMTRLGEAIATSPAAVGPLRLNGIDSSPSLSPPV